MGFVEYTASNQFFSEVKKSEKSVFFSDFKWFLMILDTPEIVFPHYPALNPVKTCQFRVVIGGIKGCLKGKTGRFWLFLVIFDKSLSVFVKNDKT